VMRVYTPPGYSDAEEYPTLYLMHGIGGDENEWFNQGAPHIIMDNLLAEGKAVPMVMVLPNGKTPKSAGNAGFENFGDVILNDLIPFMEANYSVSDQQVDRALAGLSMGGGQTVNIGFPNPDVFAWLGAFSPAPNSRGAQQTITDVDAVKNNLQFIFLSNGETEVEPYHPITQGYRDFLTAQDIPYMYQREPGAGHDFTAWKRSLYNFAQRIFTDVDSTDGGDTTSADTGDTGSMNGSNTTEPSGDGSSDSPSTDASDDTAASSAPDTDTGDSTSSATTAPNTTTTSAASNTTTTTPTTAPATSSTSSTQTTAPNTSGSTDVPTNTGAAPVGTDSEGCSCDLGRRDGGRAVHWSLGLLLAFAATWTRRGRAVKRA
jgi:enterochelin esterase-like enzyme